MRTQLIYAALATCFFALGIYAGSGAWLEELRAKREYSYVLAAYQQDKHDQASITYYHDDDFDVIGILDRKTKQRTWLLANAEVGARLKTVPRIDERHRVRLTAGDLRSIKSTVKLSEDVELFLLNSLEDEQ